MALTLYRREIEASAKTYGVDPDFLEAEVLTESAGHADAFRYEPAFFDRYLADKPYFTAFANPRRVSSSYGLLQIMYATAVQYGCTKQPEYLFLPNVNLDLGAQILRDCLKQSGGDLAGAAARYNGGTNWQAPGPQAYAATVLANLKRVTGEAA